MKLQGSIVALVTPFTDGGDAIDYSVAKSLIQMQKDGGTDGLVIGGTTGEGPTLSDDELESLVNMAIDLSDDSFKIIATCGTNCTRKSIKRAQIAKQAGADGCLATVPYYNKPCFRGLFSHFSALAEVGLPVVIYHHPGRTGISLNAEELATLHQIDGVVAIKDCGTDPSLIARICRIMPEARILSGNDDLTLPVIKEGGVGCISVIGNLMPRQWKKILSLALEGKHDEALDCYKEIEALITALNLEVNPQGIKCAMTLSGLIENKLRLPMVPVCEETEKAIALALNEWGKSKGKGRGKRLVGVNAFEFLR